MRQGSLRREYSCVQGLASAVRSIVQRMKALGWPLLVTCLLMPSSAQAGAAWWSLDETRTFLDTNGKQITTSVVTIDPRMSKLRVVSIPFEMKTAIESTQ